MTLFGKVLVFLNLALSLIFLGWAAGVVTQGFDPPPGRDFSTRLIDPNRPGRLKELEDEVSRLVGLRDKLELDLDGNKSHNPPGDIAGQILALKASEDTQDFYRNFYANQLQIAQSGKDLDDKPFDPPENPPVRYVRRTDKGFLETDPNLREPIQSLGQPVRHLTYYDAAYDALQQKIEAEQREIKQLADQVLAKTHEIDGEEGKSRGWRGKVGDQKSYLAVIDDEKAYLEPLRQHGQTYRDLLEKRFRSLAARHKELLAWLGLDDSTASTRP